MRRFAIATALVAAATSSLTFAAGDPQAGAEKAAACVACHGEGGVSENPQFPILAGQYQDYLVHSLKAYRSGARRNAIMNGLAANLSDQDIADLAAYFSAQESPLYVPDK